jgi:hypothetical protein
MSKIALNLKEFKHLKSDDKSTTLQHKDGHILTLAHKSLSPESQQQLSALSGIAKQAQTPEQANEARDQKMARGGAPIPAQDIKPMADGGTTVAKPTGDTGSAPVQDSSQYDQSMSNGWSNIKKAFSGNSKAEGGRIHMHEGDGVPFMADGGAPVLNSVQQAEQTAKQTVSERHQDAGKKAYDAGDTGEATRQAHQASAAVGAPYANGGETRKMYADGDMVDAGPTPVSSQDPNAIPEPEVKREDIKIPAIDAATKRKTEIYNSLASPPRRIGQLGQVQSENDPNLFGPNGQPPQNFNPDIAAKAEQYYAQQQNDTAAQAAQNQQQTIQQNAVKAKWGIPTDPVPDVPQGPQAPGSPQNQPAPTPNHADMPADQGQAMNSQGDPIAQYAGNLAKGFNMQEAANTGMAAEAGVQATREQAAIRQNIEDQQSVQQNYQQSYDTLDGERLKAVQDIRDGYISPEKYWKGDPSTGDGGHSKIAAGIGMILAGFNPTNNPNAAINFLKFQMEQNLNAQAKNLQAKDNILAHNIQQFGNVRDAANFHRVINAEMLQNQLGLAAAQSKGQMAKLNAQNAIGQIEREKAPLMMGISMNATMGRLAQQSNSQANNGNPTGAYEQGLAMMKRVGSPQAKTYEDALIPGIGVSKGLTPIPDAVKNQAIQYKNTNDMMNASLDFSRQYGGKNAIAMLKDPVKKAQVMAQAGTIQNQLIGQIKQAQHDGVYKPTEAEFLLSQIGGSPDSFLANLSSVPKIEEMQKLKQNEYNNLLGTYGIHNQSLPTQQAAPQYKTVNGIKYQRGPNGQAIPVK